jgi:hypothetical protein
LKAHTQLLLLLVMVMVLVSVCQNPTPDLIDAKLRHLKLHRKDTFTWDELSHLW